MASDPVSQRFTPRRIALLLAGIVLLAWLTWARLGGAQRSLVTFNGETMGTTYTVKVVLPDAALVDGSGFESLIGDALDRVDVLMSTYRDDSEIQRFNLSASLDPFPIAAENARVIDCALTISNQTVGAFDITAAPLVKAYGFGPEGRRDSPPAGDEIEAIRTRVGYDKLEFDSSARALRKLVPGLTIDLNAIAPGFAADLIGERMEAEGYADYMVEIGGEIRARGRNYEGEPWRVGIERPAENERAIQRVVPLDGMALATSGDYREYYEVDGVRISHTVDARTGRPIAHALASVSVIHEECMWADGYATAIMALGPDDGYLLAEILKLPALFILREGGGFIERATPAFEERFGPLSEEVPLAE